MSNMIGSLQPFGTAAPTQPVQGVKAADRDVFLKLLVAQLKNQDPLAPQDGVQFVSQLAQFNSLDQLININRRLEELIAQLKPASTGSTSKDSTKQ
ncbi:MAG: hypothetical protein C4334_03520 [Pyrinomonas sp.]|uniref:flagellar hook assembly protein FlgD n=1 Tax=Pyrinomonas sp. TaxID=2080306 RepID=UPI003329EFD4